jgi:hypothetical protein
MHQQHQDPLGSVFPRATSGDSSKVRQGGLNLNYDDPFLMPFTRTSQELHTGAQLTSM